MLELQNSTSKSSPGQLFPFRHDLRRSLEPPWHVELHELQLPHDDQVGADERREDGGEVDLEINNDAQTQGPHDCHLHVLDNICSSDTTITVNMYLLATD